MCKCQFMHSYPYHHPYFAKIVSEDKENIQPYDFSNYIIYFLKPKYNVLSIYGIYEDNM